MNDELIAFGVYSDGSYLVDPNTTEETIARFALQEGGVDEYIYECLLARKRRDDKTHLGPVPRVDVSQLQQTGWGIVIPSDLDPDILVALKPLLDVRRAQCGGSYEEGGRYRELVVSPGCSMADLFTKYKIGPNIVDPAKGVPYYLMIVADPERISFEFQYQLDVEYAVGRLHFDGEKDEVIACYGQYAKSAASPSRRKKKATIFGVKNYGDSATRASSERLCRSLAESLAIRPDWTVDSIGTWKGANGQRPTQARFRDVLVKDQPALLFSASHGKCVRRRQKGLFEFQGAIVTEDWEGPFTKMEREHIFAGEDVPDDASFAGMIAFLFACYGGGTPKQDDFIKFVEGKPSREIAPRPFIAALPQALLSHRRGSALAVVAHVDKAWTTSFIWNGDTDVTAFDAMMHQVAGGVPVGHAMDPFNSRYAQLSTLITSAVHEFLKAGEAPDHLSLSRTWTANNDARAYVLLGDPASRLHFETQDGSE